MEFKNRTFKIFGETWKIKFKDEVHYEGESTDNYCFGVTDSSNNTIQISLKDKQGLPLPSRTIKLTINHELVHAIFDSGQYKASSNDEPLVEWTAKCITSLIEQKML